MSAEETITIATTVGRAWAHVAARRTLDGMQLLAGVTGVHVRTPAGEWVLGQARWSPWADHPAATQLATVVCLGQPDAVHKLVVGGITLVVGGHLALRVAAASASEARALVEPATWLARELDEWGAILERVAADR